MDSAPCPESSWARLALKSRITCRTGCVKSGTMAIRPAFSTTNARLVSPGAKTTCVGALKPIPPNADPTVYPNGAGAARPTVEATKNPMRNRVGIKRKTIE